MKPLSRFARKTLVNLIFALVTIYIFLATSLGPKIVVFGVNKLSRNFTIASSSGTFITEASFQGIKGLGNNFNLARVSFLLDIPGLLRQAKLNFHYISLSGLQFTSRDVKPRAGAHKSGLNWLPVTVKNIFINEARLDSLYLKQAIANFILSKTNLDVNVHSASGSFDGLNFTTNLGLSFGINDGLQIKPCYLKYGTDTLRYSNGIASLAGDKSSIQLNTSSGLDDWDIKLDLKLASISTSLQQIQINLIKRQEQINCLAIVYSKLKRPIIANLALPISNNLRTFSSMPVTGEIRLIDEPIATFFPGNVVTGSGTLQSITRVSGVLSDLNFTTNVVANDASLCLRGIETALSFQQLSAKSNQNGDFSIQGSGSADSGTFHLRGMINPFLPNKPNKFIIKGRDLVFITSNNSSFTLNPDLTFAFANDFKQMNIDGNAVLSKADVDIRERSFGPKISEDVVLVDRIEPKVKSNFRIKPNLALDIQDNCKFNGFGFTSMFHGKVNVNSDDNNALRANGKILLRDGVYWLPGKKLKITRGDITYPPGRLLQDPIVNAELIMPDAEKQRGSLATRQGFLLTGRLMQPKIVFNNSTDAKALGIVENAVGQSLQAIGQFALLMNPKSNFLLNNLEKLNFNEIGIKRENSDTHEFSTIGIKDDAANLDDKLVFVVGKNITSRLYAQYMRNLANKQDKLRLSYSLSKHFDFGLEAGFGEEGNTSGADILFSYEKN